MLRFEIFQKYKSKIENQLNKKIKRWRLERGGKYELCEQHGITHETILHI